MPRLVAPILVLAASLSLLSGCRDPEIASYRVRREAQPSPLPPAAASSGAPVAAPTPAGRDMASTPVNTAQGPGLGWTTPADWKNLPDKPMRKATLELPAKAGQPAIELAITAFPGDVGGNLANVNRWRGQIQLPPITEAELPATLSRIEANGLTFLVVDLKGPAQRTLGAIVPHQGATWFFKVTAADAAIAAHKDSILAFLQTVRAR